MSAWARPGVKCVCVKRMPIMLEPNGDPPTVGRVYTIRDVVPSPSGGTSLALFELHRWDAWRSDGFRPLVSKSESEDLALFRHHIEAVHA